MILLNDGEFIAGSTWVVGYKPTDEDSVKIKGGLWLNEVGMEDTKKEPTMMDLNGSKVGDKFNCENGHRPELVFILGDNYCCELNGELFLYKVDGGLIRHVSENGEHLVSKHDSRHWLKDLPDADIFADDVNHIASNCDSLWYWYTGESRERGNCFVANTGDVERLKGIKMPKLTGDEWKQSKISIADLRDWQKANG